MNRRQFAEQTAAAAFLTLTPVPVRASLSGVPWEKLRRAIGGRLVPVQMPPMPELLQDLRNPYAVGGNPALTQTVGWLDAWKNAPSPYAVAAQDAHDVAQAIEFAHKYGIRVAIRGGGHSYLGTSNHADSLLIWTRRMRDIQLATDSVTLGSGNIWAYAYNAVTTQQGRYVQGGGCATVGVAGLIQSGGFGSFSKGFGTAASGLLEAQIVTADGVVRTVNDANEPDLLWALKGGGGGTFGVVTRLKLRTHPLPPYFGAAVATVKASSDAAYRRLVRHFVAFYKEALFNQHFGETVGFHPDNRLTINLVVQGLDTGQIQKIWKPFFDWVKASPGSFALQSEPIMLAGDARGWWDPAYWRKTFPSAITLDQRPGRGNDWWWAGDGGQVGWFIYNYESLWLPESLLHADLEQTRLANALYAASRHFPYNLHFNKGIAGAPPAAIAATKRTATNPSVVSAFALAICADGDQGILPGVNGHDVDKKTAQQSAGAIHSAMNELRAIAPHGGSYLSESSYFDSNFREDYWGDNYARLQAIKRKYDPANFFSVRNGVVGRS